MSEETANTHGAQNVIESGDEHQVQMILGSRERIRHAGIIRAGRKTLKGQQSPEIKNRFAELEAKGLSYDDIDRELGGEPKSRRSKLRPVNCDHFVVRACDFRNPSDADFITENYADADGLVRRIPIWFTMDQIDKVIPHNFRAFDGSGKVRAASFYDEHGNLAFKYLEKGAREIRDDSWKVIVTEDPDEVSKLCGYQVQFGGMYRVNVVGLRTIGEVIVPTQSWYGLGDAVAVLKRIQAILGRSSGLVNGDHFLELVKVPETVKTPDGKMQTQWIITIDAAVDPMELARHAEQAATRGMSAIGLLNAGAPKKTRKATEPDLTPVEVVEEHEDPVESSAKNEQNRHQEPQTECERGVSAICSLISGRIEKQLIDAFTRNTLGCNLEEVTDSAILRNHYKLIRSNVDAELSAFTKYCQELLENETKQAS